VRHVAAIITFGVFGRLPNKSLGGRDLDLSGARLPVLLSPKRIAPFCTLLGVHSSRLEMPACRCVYLACQSAVPTKRLVPSGLLCDEMCCIRRAALP